MNILELEKCYWLVDPKTKEVNQKKIKAFFMGGQYHIPDCALLTEPLPEKKGFAVIAKSDLSGTEYIEDHREKTVYKTTDKSPLEIKELGGIPDGYTLLVPNQFDEWVVDKWVKNAQREHEHCVKECDQNRKNEYQQKVDPLLNESHVKRLLNDTYSANELEKKALAERQKIQGKYPWPTNPNAKPL